MLAVSLSLGTRKVIFPKPAGRGVGRRDRDVRGRGAASRGDQAGRQGGDEGGRDTGRGRDTELLFIGEVRARGGQRTGNSVRAVVAVNSSSRTLTSSVQVPAPGMVIPSPT